MKLRQIIKRVLKEEKENKDKIILSILKKFIPDNTVMEFSYPLPYAEDRGLNVDVEIEFSIGSDLGVTTVENDGKFSGYILSIPLIIHDAKWRGPGEKFHPAPPNAFRSPTLVAPFVNYVDNKIWKGIPIIEMSFQLIFDNGEELIV